MISTCRQYKQVINSLVINVNICLNILRRQDPGDRKYETDNKKQVNWNKYVECKTYQVESSLSTIDLDATRTMEIPCTKNQEFIPEHYYTYLNDNNQQQR